MARRVEVGRCSVWQGLAGEVARVEDRWGWVRLGMAGGASNGAAWSVVAWWGLAVGECWGFVA